MAAPRRGGGQNNFTSYSANSANNKQAQLTNAYQELAKELGTDKLKVVGGYTLGRVIGTYGSVHLATHRLSGTRCAIKKIPKSFTPHLTREIHHHRRLHHPSIVHLHEIIATENNIWLVTELCSGGELFDYLVERGRMLEGEARKLFGELVVAVGWMHRQGVVHRDLKLENVLLDGELRIKLGDLGFVREWQRGRLMETFCGTTGYASPEMLAGRKYLGVETDIWSMGIILYTLLCGGLPFDDDDERVMKELIMKGEYDEPEWLSEEARSLIRSMLQQEPSQRITVEGIFEHPWFKMTLVDRIQGHAGDSHSIPPSPLPDGPASGDELFSEPFNKSATTGSLHLTPHLAQPSPLSTNVPTVPNNDSEPSEPSVAGSETGKAESTDTTPPTTAEEDDGEEMGPPFHRVNSSEFSATEKALELLHPNSSQSTIRRPASISPKSSSQYKSKVARRSTLEGQKEEDEEGSDVAASLPTPDDHSLHLPLAQHSRTPSRTKRRSVSSTMSVERRHSHHSMSGQWQRYLPEDYLAKLNETPSPPFTTSSEKYLLNQLNDMGMDIGQLKHSVENDACDSSAAMWWILRAKQADRGETNEVIEARETSAAKKREKLAHYAREERRKAREAAKEQSQGITEDSSDSRFPAAVTFKDGAASIPVTPSFTIMDLGAPISGTGQPVFASPDVLPVSSDTSAIDALNAVKTPQFELRPLPGTLAPNTAPPTTPPRDPPLRDLLSSPDASPARADDDRTTKRRSPSMSMLQRATSAWVGVSGKKNEEKERAETDSPASHKDEKRSTSPSKLLKPPPRPKHLPRPDGDHDAASSSHPTPASTPPASGTPLTTPQREKQSTLGKSAGQNTGGAVDLTEEMTASTSGNSITADQLVAGSSKQPKGNKRDSLWTTFRHLFNEDKRRRKRDIPGSPLAGSETKVPPSVVLTRGPNGRVPHINRTPVSLPPGSRRTSLDGRPAMHSRRSSSISNSRRSSFDGHVMHETHDLGGLYRRTSQRSHGSQTPTSDREYIDFPSRPGSAHSVQRGNSRRSSMSMRSPSLVSDHASGRFKSGQPASPLHNYRRRAPGGSDSSRVRHYRVIHENQALRPSSVTSSIKSNASSRASSVERKRDTDREDDSGRDDTASLRSQRRKRSEGGSGKNSSLAQQIHRTRSPLSASQPAKKGPTRDVFQKKQDDDWISEEEDEFAGGLGQIGNTSSSNSGQRWLNGTRASAYPGLKFSNPSTKRKERGRRTSLEEKHDKLEEDGRTGLGIGMEGPPGSTNSGRARRGLPPGRSAATVIEEEEEDEE
uniref:CAMK/CAMKL protein kinase n=1 Tax=Kwoniella pini CBS 10737 TaxID=1296096 RepID=A0A1B9I8E6_9TREE|nr:CAMK/CAMKL protein kinase [Kwoniella pini CBS 10737]OCF51779.1 CAMK/CAMKL protein kinase [Kwoniella pini CBS 10737]